MSTLPDPETAVSAPGKVLLAGGYLVLDRDYTGSVFALNARIHVIIHQLPQRKGAKLKLSAEPEAQRKAQGESRSGEAEKVIVVSEDNIIVKSPQFIDAIWEYKILKLEQEGGIKVEQKNVDRPRNPFLETALNYSLTYVSYISKSKNFGSLLLNILADNDYYSETATSVTSSEGLKKFGVRLEDAHKTGLGSSAALVTAVVSAIVAHRAIKPQLLKLNKEKIHNLAQAAHCAAQGKIGSGFDVAAAVYGTCHYRRFSPSILSDLGEPGSPKFESRLFNLVEDLDKRWDAECRHVGAELPSGMQMVLCDVDCGSQTPGMVKKLLKWREENRHDADTIWAGLEVNNEKIRAELERLVQIRGGSGNFTEIRNLLLRSRLWIRTMTKKSGVPIEPLVQSELLDDLGKLEGVIGGVVPGAGGYDAIALLIEDDPDVAESISDLLYDWKSSIEDDFGGKIEKVRLLNVRHNPEGLKNESILRYRGWI